MANKHKSKNLAVFPVKLHVKISTARWDKKRIGEVKRETPPLLIYVQARVKCLLFEIESVNTFDRLC